MATATKPGVLTFDAEPHLYYWNGRQVPNCTSILEDVGIIDYSKIPHETRENALSRGGRVHLATQFDDEFFIGASRQPLDEDSVSEEDRGYLLAWRRFRSEKRFRPELIEHRGYNERYGYAGTLDRTGYFESNPQQRILIDLKTGSAEWWVRLQLASYAAFFDGPRVFRRICLELHGDGTWRNAGEFTGAEWQVDFNEFLYALKVHNMKREKRWKG